MSACVPIHLLQGFQKEFSISKRAPFHGKGRLRKKFFFSLRNYHFCSHQTTLSYISQNITKCCTCNLKRRTTIVHLKQYYPIEHPRVSWAKTHLGIVYIAIGDYKAGKILLEESLTNYRKYYSDNHPSIIWVLRYLNNIK